ncbi:MAG: hypothetical protein GYB33_13165 [Gammaproteobacteria bacterium]|nr:hypothetical protein [Gammaproteobacteria bacterium]
MIIQTEVANRPAYGRGVFFLVMTLVLMLCGFQVQAKPATSNVTVHYILAPVDDGSCTIRDKDTNEVLAGPLQTHRGSVMFKKLPADLHWVLVQCEGGQYTDQASGEQQDAVMLRTYADISGKKSSVSVTPLTELAVRELEIYGLDVAADFPALLANLAAAFGLQGTDLVATEPRDMNFHKNNGRPQDRYGAMLAAISQLQADMASSSVIDAIDLLSGGIANNGFFDDEFIRSALLDALENAHLNDRLAKNIGSDDEFHELHHEILLAPLVSQVEYVHADHPDAAVGEAFTKIQANERSLFDVVGKHLSLRLNITLGGVRCRLRDLQHTHTSHSDSELDLLYAQCPPQPEGTADLVVMDGERVEITVPIEVVDFNAPAPMLQSRSMSFATATAVTGSSTVHGHISAEAPGVLSNTTGAHSYKAADLEIFNVAGVTVELVDRNGTVLATTTTDDAGAYQFANAPAATDVAIVVKAHLQKQRTTPGEGPQYNFWVRDNTSSSQPRALYQVKSSYVTTLADAGSSNTIDLRAKIGFDEAGHVTSEAMRQSAAFSILRVVKSSVKALESANPNLELPELNLYWSGKNIAVSGDRAKGQIDTTHYDASGLAPGIYVLGKADVDTDEFDRGVLGHEFGHYLQAQLAFSDSPGGSHSDSEFKDASLAFGEGYGTALGGLLAESNIYCDASGLKQTDTYCIDLNLPVAASHPNGFYSEAANIHLLYGIGKLPGKGVPAFFNAVSELKNNVHSATVFAFLHNYLSANPDVAGSVDQLMTVANIKTSDPFGTLPAGTAADPAISAAANQGEATTGANDLEKIYLPLAVNSPSAPAANKPAVVITANAPSFCINHNLQGANSHNGLGMSRRFSFTPAFTGGVALRVENGLGHEFSIQSSSFSVRDDAGADVHVWDYSGPDQSNYYGEIDVTAGQTYSVLFHVWEPDAIPKGSACGYKPVLGRIY